MMFDIDVERLYQSKTWLIAPPDMRPWLLRLWVESWRSIPVGAFEDDDELIAARIQMPESLFQAHRKILMRGWAKHSDGYLYHPTITELVMKIVNWRERERIRKEEYREREKEKRKDKMSHGTDAGQTRTDMGKTLGDATSSSSSSSSSSAIGEANASVEQMPDSPVLKVFAHWQDVMNHPKARLDRKRRAAIASRLKDGYTVDDLKRAVDGCRASAWHQGKNKDGKIFDDVELICRNAVNVERFAGIASQQRKAQTELDQWLNDEPAIDGSYIDGECSHV
jgi:hypothetical protein